MPYAYQGGDNCYGRGDYYRGDYYRGDPGIFGALKKIAGGALRILKAGATGGPLGATAALLSEGQRAVTGRQTRLPAPLQQFPVFAPIGTPSSSMIAGLPVQTLGASIGLEQPVGTMLPASQGGFLPGVCGLKGTHPNRSNYFKAVPGNPSTAVLIPRGSVCVKNRRLNPTNPRALRRAIRRGRGFIKLARKAAGAFGFTIVGKGGRRKGKKR